MADGRNSAYGNLRFEGDLYALAALLSRTSLKAAMRESCHYEAGHYLLVRAIDGEVRIEAESADEFLMHIELPENEPESFCELLTKALGEVDVAHEVELYDDDERLKRHYHHE